MSLTVVYAFLFYVATLILVIGVGRKIYIYASTPQPLKIPTTPAPLTKIGVVWRLIKEVTVFQALFRANKWIWIFAILFHAGLLVVLLRHFRYFIEPVWFWVDLIQPIGKYGAFAMVAGLGGLWARRFLVDRVRYISNLSDHLMLALLLLIGLSGLVMTFISHTDIVQLKAFVQGLMYFDHQALPTTTPLLIHLGLVLVLMVIFPISKLLHAPGVFFSPTRNQVDNPREKRHVDGWTAKPNK
jgi:nitrate reductase gamma subunit